MLASVQAAQPPTHLMNVCNLEASETLKKNTQLTEQLIDCNRKKETSNTVDVALVTVDYMLD